MLSAIGQPVPDTAHAVSVSLPSWKATVGYEEGEEWVLSKMKTGYPRFFIHLTIQELQSEILQRYGKEGESTMLFPSSATAKRCQRFLYDKVDSLNHSDVRLLNLVPVVHTKSNGRDRQTVVSGLSCVFFPTEYFSVAKQVWQHSGDGISSRRGEFCLKALNDGLLRPETGSVKYHQEDHVFCRGPRRYQRGGSRNGIVYNISGPTDSVTQDDSNTVPDGNEYAQFVEERFGRNLNAELASKAKVAIKRRIAGCLTDESELDEALENWPLEGCPRRVQGLTEDDVFLYPAGMSAIFNTHRILMAYRETPLKSICFGFPYIDTLKILQKWGPGCLFYGHGNSADLDDLEKRLEGGERFLALFTEFPSNPLLNAPDLTRIRALADRYDFTVVVDETVGNFININVLSHADVVVSSLTKIFSGDSNVMGGSCVLNPQGRMYTSLKVFMAAQYEDNYWAEDAVFMERNSRDFISRIDRVNANAAAIAAALQDARRSGLVREVYYPLYRPSAEVYERHRHRDGGSNSSSDNHNSNANGGSEGSGDANDTKGKGDGEGEGGYGGLLSVTFWRREHAVGFFDALEVQKGPSLGTNFTLACPYAILAHYAELDWAASFGVLPDLIRISVGLEDRGELVGRIQRALKAAENVA